MYFILSKVLLIFIHPLAWVTALLIYVVFVRNTKKKQRLLIVALAALYFFSIKFTADIFARMWDVAPYRQTNKTYSAAILLGGFVSEGADGNGYFNWAADRYVQTLKLYRNGTVKYILFSGGNADINPDGFAEAAFVKTELQRAAVPDSLVILENKARNTAENAAYAEPLLKNSGLKPPFLLVTSAFHMRRASIIFKKAGIDFVPYPSHYMVARHITFADFIPDTEAMMEWELYIKEVVGYFVALF